MTLVACYRVLVRCPDCGATEEREETAAPVAAPAALEAALGTVDDACPCAQGAVLLVDAIEVVTKLEQSLPLAA
jgi:hypothetical protein